MTTEELTKRHEKTSDYFVIISLVLILFVTLMYLFTEYTKHEKLRNQLETVPIEVNA